MIYMHTETYEAFKAAGVPDDKARVATVDVAGDTRTILESIADLNTKFAILTTFFSTALTIIGLMLVFLLKHNGS